MSIRREEETGLFHARLAQRAPAFQQSVWESIELLVAGAGPETIFFGNGNPARKAGIPFDRMREAATRTWDVIAQTPGAIDYGEPEGVPAYREMIRERIRARAESRPTLSISANDRQPAGDRFSCRLLLEKGDVIVVEGPTYLGGEEIRLV
ncbi:MAG: hypothetical protein R2845_11690 [Thermomicrobiales bacterium]